MNHDDELRDALERMSATPPVPIDRVESVHRRARRLRQRHAVVASVMSVAVVAAAVGIAIPLLQTHHHNSRLIQGGPAASESGFGLRESPAASPSPRPSVSHKPKAHPAAGVSHVVPSVGPSEQPAEDVHFAVEAHQDPDASDGYPLTVIELHVTGVVEGNISNVWMQYDDNMNRLDGHSYPYPCTHDDTFTAVDKTYTFKWHYRNAGTDHVFGGVWTGPCGNTTTQHQFSAQIDIPMGSTHSNGITEPTVTLHGSTPSGNHLGLSVTGYDLDGWIQTITVDWGDGSAPVVSSYPSCKDWNGTTWPYGYQTEDYTSEALAAGTYHVTVTVTTAGCDGKDVQTASDTWTATVS